MIDHVILTVSDFKRSVAFYTEALKPLGITTFIDYEGKDGHPDLKGFGDGKRYVFWLKEGRPDPQAVHVGFVAKDRSQVNAFYEVALAPEGRARSHLKFVSNTILVIMRHGWSILTATTLKWSIRVSGRKVLFAQQLQISHLPQHADVLH